VWSGGGMRSAECSSTCHCRESVLH